MLAELEIGHIKEFFAGVPMVKGGRRIGGAEFFHLLWNEKGLIPMDWNYGSIHPLERFLIERGTDALGFGTLHKRIRKTASRHPEGGSLDQGCARENPPQYPARIRPGWEARFRVPRVQAGLRNLPGTEEFQLRSALLGVSGLVPVPRLATSLQRKARN
jgi:hypothetical protein